MSTSSRFFQRDELKKYGYLYHESSTLYSRVSYMIGFFLIKEYFFDVCANNQAEVS